MSAHCPILDLTTCPICKSHLDKTSYVIHCQNYCIKIFPNVAAWVQINSIYSVRFSIIEHTEFYKNGKSESSLILTLNDWSSFDWIFDEDAVQRIESLTFYI